MCRKACLAQLMKQWLIELLVVGGEFYTIVTSVTDGKSYSGQPGIPQRFTNSG